MSGVLVDADDVELGVDVDGDLGPVALHDVGLVRSVAVHVGLDPLDCSAADLRQSDLRHLARRLAGERRFVTALVVSAVARRLDGRRPAVLRVDPSEFCTAPAIAAPPRANAATATSAMSVFLIVLDTDPLSSLSSEMVATDPETTLGRSLAAP